MKKLALVMVAALMTMIATASPGGAITYGEPDDGEHPYVGFMIFFDPTEASWFSCTGSLLDADTLLTAGHCVYGVGTDGEEVLDPDGEIVTSGGTDMWVTFEDTDVLAGWPDRADYDTTEALYDARSAWLDDNRGLCLRDGISEPRLRQLLRLTRSTTTSASSSSTRQPT